MVPPSKDTFHYHLRLFQAQVELAVKREGRCVRQKSSVDQVLEAQERVDAGGLAQGRGSGGKVMGEAAEEESRMIPLEVTEGWVGGGGSKLAVIAAIWPRVIFLGSLQVEERVGLWSLTAQCVNPWKVAYPSSHTG